jgi:hypothetical protein
MSKNARPSQKRMARSGCRSCECLRKRSTHPRELASAPGDELPNGHEEDRCIEVRQRVSWELPAQEA